MFAVAECVLREYRKTQISTKIDRHESVSKRANANGMADVKLRLCICDASFSVLVVSIAFACSYSV